MRLRSMNTVLSMALAAAMVLGNVPVTAYAVTGSQVAADGTKTSASYDVTNPYPDDDDWADYKVTVSLTAKDGNISDIDVTPSDGYDQSKDETYFNGALNGRRGAQGIKSLVGQPATEDTINGWDAVASATYVSNAIKSAALDAIAQFDEKVNVDKTSLQSAVDSASQLTQGNYTDESWAAFTSALTSAQSVLSNESATQDEVDNAVTSLANAQNALEEKVVVSKDSLKTAIDEASALSEDDYTADSWSAFQTALTDAQTVYNNADATQDQVDSAVSALTEAQGKLEEKPAEEDVYVLMNIPYSQFYAKFCGTADQIDAVSTATTKNKAGAYIDAGTNYGTKSDSGSTVVNGVTIPVKLSAADYAAVKDLVSDSTADYYVGSTVDNPSVYMEVSYSDEKYTFGDLKGTSSDGGTVKATEEGVKWNTKRRDAEIEFEEGSSITSIAASDLYGGYVTTTDGESYPLLPVESMYKAKSLGEIGWTLGDKIVEEKNNSLVMNLQPNVFSGLKGKTLNTITCITKTGIVTYSLTDQQGEQLKLEEEEKAEDIYVLMNIPYSDFYKLVGAGDVDVTSAATTKVRISDRAGASYNGGGSVEASDTSKGVQSKGVQFPVKVSGDLLKDSKYTEVTDDTSYTVSYIAHGQAVDPVTLTGENALIQADDYAYYKLSDTPANYVELTADGFSAVQGDVKTVSDAAEIKYGSRWGTYEVDLTTGLGNDVAGAVVVKTDKLTFGLKPTQHFWQSHELAWTPTGDLEATNGATLESVTVYTKDGVYEYTVNKELVKKYYSGTVNATLYKETGTIGVLPDDIENPKVTVSRTEGSGRGAVTTTYIDSAALGKDGSFVIPEDAGLEDGTEYTVSVSSDNYTDISASATYSNSTMYVIMNIPYADFYKLVGAGDVDVTSGATAKVRNAGVAGATYNGGGDAENTDNVTDKAKGVQFAVKVEDESLLKDYTQVTNATSYKVAYSGRGQTTNTTLKGKDALIQADDYAYYQIGSVPANYLELTADGFSEVKGDTVKVDGTNTDITYGSHWGTYQLDLPKEVEGRVAAVKVTTDKLTFGLKATDNIWRSMEIAWTPKDKLEASNGATLKSLTVYTDEGVYEITINEELAKKLYTEEITSSLEYDTGKVSGLPDDIENAKVTVSYTEGSGRGAVTTTYIDSAALGKDGSFVIPEDAGLEDGKEYTVSVSSDNYTDLSSKATYTKNIYVLMNIPYSEFYKAVEGGSVDATSSATTKVRITDRAGASYNGGGSVEASDTSKGMLAKGVQFPVKVSEKLLQDQKDTYTEVTDDTEYHVSYIAHGKEESADLKGKDSLIQADDYAYYKISDTPDYYLELTEDGLSELKNNSGSVTSIEPSSVIYTDRHATYAYDLPEGAISGKIAGATVQTDKLTFNLTTTGQIFKSSELGWNPEGDLAATNGATLEKITIYTDEGKVYTVDVNEKLKALYNQAITSTLVDETGTINNLPEDISNAKATISYTTDDGKSVTVLSDAAVSSDGTFAIPKETVKLVDGKEYDVTVSSDNYIDLSAKATYGATIDKVEIDIAQPTMNFTAGTVIDDDFKKNLAKALVTLSNDQTNTITGDGLTFEGLDTLSDLKPETILNNGTEVKTITVSYPGAESRTIRVTVSPASYTTTVSYPSGNSYQKNSGKALVVTSSAGSVKAVYVDGKEVDAKNYDVTGGSVAFKSSYVDTLSDGEHEVTILSNDGKATTKVTIGKTSSSDTDTTTDKDSTDKDTTKDTSGTDTTANKSGTKSSGSKSSSSGSKVSGGSSGSSGSSGGSSSGSSGSSTSSGSSKSAKTGDSAQTTMWVTISVIAAAAIVLLIAMKRRKRS